MVKEIWKDKAKFMVKVHSNIVKSIGSKNHSAYMLYGIGTEIQRYKTPKDSKTQCRRFNYFLIQDVIDFYINSGEYKDHKYVERLIRKELKNPLFFRKIKNGKVYFVGMNKLMYQCGLKPQYGMSQCRVYYPQTKLSKIRKHIFFPLIAESNYIKGVETNPDASGKTQLHYGRSLETIAKSLDLSLATVKAISSKRSKESKIIRYETIFKGDLIRANYILDKERKNPKQVVFISKELDGSYIVKRKLSTYYLDTSVGKATNFYVPSESQEPIKVATYYRNPKRVLNNFNNVTVESEMFLELQKQFRVATDKKLKLKIYNFVVNEFGKNVAKHLKPKRFNEKIKHQIILNKISKQKNWD